MVIQSNGASLLYLMASRQSGQQVQNSAATTGGDAAESAGRVTLSDTARALSAGEAATSFTTAQQMVLKEAAQNPEYAQSYAHDMGNMHGTIVYDISHGDVRKLSSTGQNQSAWKG